LEGPNPIMGELFMSEKLKEMAFFEEKRGKMSEGRKIENILFPLFKGMGMWEKKVRERTEKYEKIIYSFSGGKGSTLAILLILPFIEKPVEAIFVDSGVEIPGLIEFAQGFCERKGIPFKVLHPKKDFMAVYGREKKFPDSIFKHCVYKFRIDPLNDYISKLLSEGVSVLTVRGGRKAQRMAFQNSRWVGGEFWEYRKNNRLKVPVWSPCFGFSRERYGYLLKAFKGELWDGYKKGFKRTACWCCPFQDSQQWEALRKNFPDLWEKMREMALTWDYRKYRGDKTFEKLKHYWKQFE